MADLKKCIVVLGMHRSGTSALLGVVHRLGVPIGSTTLADVYEHPEAVDFNERLLFHFGRGWDCLGSLPHSWWMDPGVEAYKQELNSIICREFGKYPLWGIKDPRMCITLPVWLAAFASLSIQPVFIVAIRNPLEIAKSHARRDEFSQQKSILLWMNYMLAAEYHSRGRQRLFINYSELMADPEAVTARIVQHFRLGFLRPWGQAADDIRQFLKPELKHHNLYDVDALSRFPDEFKAVENLLERACHPGQACDQYAADFDELRNRFNRWQDVFITSEVRESLEQVHSLRETAYKHLNRYGGKLIEERNFGDALGLFKDLIALYPRSARAWNNLGIAYEQAGDTTGARDCFQRALAIDPAYVYAAGNLKRVMT
jgi:hypothetical protein